MSALFLSLLAVMLIGWSSALPLPSPSNATNDVTVEEEDPEWREYFERAAEMMNNARGSPSNATGAMVAEYTAGVDPWNPEEMGEYFQGDILWPMEKGDGRNGLLAKSARWPNGVVYFAFNSKVKSGAQKMIRSAMDSITKNVPCIKFVPLPPKAKVPGYVFFTTDKTGCWSYVGMVGGRQEINLQDPGCTGTLGTPVHEIMHALGFFHEQSRFDRDDYITIQLENVTPGMANNFNKVDAGKTTSFDVPYTFSSVMHYSNYAFSKNGKPTIVAKSGTPVMGQRESLHENDITKLRKMYGCP